MPFHDISFNPCCVGNSSGSTKSITSSFDVQKVSILVVLEIVLEVRSKKMKTTEEYCFNPCCVGNSSGSAQSV